MSHTDRPHSRTPRPLAALALCAATTAVLTAIVLSATALTAAAASAAAQTAVARPAAVTYTLITEPAAGYTPIYNLVTAATTSVDMTMYELTDTTAEADLAADAARGVTVRVILDTNLEKTNNTPAYTYLTDHGVHVVWAATSYAATHQKTITIDNATTAIMTGNLTSQYYTTSRDFAVIENNSFDVKAIEKTFNADYAHTAITPTDGDHLVWSPTDSQTQLLALIDNATTSLAVENEEMGDPAITTALENAAERGVTVDITMTNDDNEYATEFDALVAAGAHVHTYAYTASLYIHAKVIIADQTQVFLGSENFSNASLNKNRELGFVTTSTAIINPVNTTLTSDYNGGTNWT